MVCWLTVTEVETVTTPTEGVLGQEYHVKGIIILVYFTSLPAGRGQLSSRAWFSIALLHPAHVHKGLEETSGEDHRLLGAINIFPAYCKSQNPISRISTATNQYGTAVMTAKIHHHIGRMMPCSVTSVSYHDSTLLDVGHQM